MSWWWWLGIVVGGLLALLFAAGAIVALAISALALVSLPMSIWQRWRDERRRVTWHAPGLGDLSSLDGKAWTAEIGELTLFVDTHGGPPSPSQLQACRLLCADLQRIRSLAFDYLKADGTLDSCLGPGVQQLDMTLASLQLKEHGRFTATLEHSSDVYTGYIVDFVDGAVVDSMVIH